MTREPIEVTRQDRIFCLKASSGYHSEVCEECKFYPDCDHMTQDDMAELTIKDLEALEQDPCDDILKTIKNNCYHRRRCKGCKFLNADTVRCKLVGVPSEWEFI